MDSRGTKPEGTCIPAMMQQMKQLMEKMCGAGEVSPAAVCQEMMSSAGKMPDMGGCAMPVCCKRAQAREREAAPAPYDE